MADEMQRNQQEEETNFSFTSSGETGSSGAVQGAAPVTPGNLPVVGGTLFVNHAPDGMRGKYLVPPGPCPPAATIGAAAAGPPPGPMTQLPRPSIPTPHVPSYQRVSADQRASSLGRVSDMSRGPVMSGAAAAAQSPPRSPWQPSRSPDIRQYPGVATPGFSPIANTSDRASVTPDPATAAAAAAPGTITVPILPIRDFGFEVTVEGAPTEREVVQILPPTPPPGSVGDPASPTGNSPVTGGGLLTTKSAARAKMPQRPDSLAMAPPGVLPVKTPPPRPGSREPTQGAPLHPKAQATVDRLNQTLQIQRIPIPQYQFETYVDWNSLDRSSYDAQKMQDAFNFRFRGCKDWVMPNDKRMLTTKVWQAILDKVTNVFGKSDAYVDMKANFYAQFQKELASGDALARRS